jgi:hypothetical protein
MEKLEIYQWTSDNGGRGHVAATSEEDALQTMQARGLQGVSVQLLTDELIEQQRIQEYGLVLGN